MMGLCSCLCLFSRGGSVTLGCYVHYLMSRCTVSLRTHQGIPCRHKSITCHYHHPLSFQPNCIFVFFFQGFLINWIKKERGHQNAARTGIQYYVVVWVFIAENGWVLSLKLIIFITIFKWIKYIWWFVDDEHVPCYVCNLYCCRWWIAYPQTTGCCPTRWCGPPSRWPASCWAMYSSRCMQGLAWCYTASPITSKRPWSSITSAWCSWTPSLSMRWATQLVVQHNLIYFNSFYECMIWQPVLCFAIAVPDVRMGHHLYLEMWPLWLLKQPTGFKGKLYLWENLLCISWDAIHVFIQWKCFILYILNMHSYFNRSWYYLMPSIYSVYFSLLSVRWFEWLGGFTSLNSSSFWTQ